MKKRSAGLAGGLGLLLLAAPAFPDVYPETEPNDTKAAADVFTGLVSGDTVTGFSTGTSTTSTGIVSADYFRLATAPAAQIGVYRHTLVITSSIVGHTGTIRGLTQLGGVISAGSDVQVQASSTSTIPPRFNQWYDLGTGSEIVYRVTGISATNQQYTLTLTTTEETPLDLGQYVAGQIEITTVDQGHTTDTDLWVFDAAGQPIPGFGNDDEGPDGATNRSRLTRDYEPGLYYLAISNFNLATSEATPLDDDFQNGPVLDFAGAAVNSSTSAGLALTFEISDALGAQQFAAVKANPFDVAWAVFEVLGTCGDSVRGDSNCDGLVNFDDIECFVAALIGPEAWDLCGHGGDCDYFCQNDVNGDEAVNFDDIETFILCLIGGACP